MLLVASVALSSCKKKETEATAVKGCTDPNSLTFNSEANEDDGSCEYIEQVNRAAYMHFTEDWCPPCGKYGGPTFDSCVKTLEGSKITCMKVYEGSNNNTLENPYAILMENASNYNITAIPTMFLNSDKSGVLLILAPIITLLRVKQPHLQHRPVLQEFIYRKRLMVQT